MKAKKEIIVATVLVAMVLVTLFLYVMGTREIAYDQIVSIGIVLVLVGLAMYIAWDKIRNVQKGLPGKDERVISISHKAGYYGFIAAIWSAVLIPTIIDILFAYELDGGDISAIVVLVSGFVFVISYIYLYRKGK
jgi:predicted ABC-type exoprotein transport system permease subunit